MKTKDKFTDFPDKMFYEYEGDIYEYYRDNGYFLKVTGWVSGEDRRKYKWEIDIDKLKKLNKRDVKERINNIWNSGVRTWKFNGETYSNDGDLSVDYGKLPIHKFVHHFKSVDGLDREYVEQYRLVWHQGHLFWCKTYHYFPRVMLFRFESIDKEATSDSFAKWTNVKNCKPVVNSRGEYI